MHSALGLADHHDRVRRLASEPIARVVDCLVGAGFTTFITADHGGVEVTGSGFSPRGGVTTTSKGSRVVAFKSEALRSAAMGEAGAAARVHPVGVADPRRLLPVISAGTPDVWQCQGPS